MNEYDFEPVPGLPERPPPGERILWQGAPCWRSLSRRLFHVRKITVYFAILMVWYFFSSRADGASTMEAAQSALLLVPVLLAGLALLALLAWLIGRTTVYTITNRRLVLRIGIALPVTINVPFNVVESADFKAFAGGTGDISVSLSDEQRVGYAVLWPHARPWRLRRPEPTLRSIPDAARTAELLSDALAAAHPAAEQQADAGDPSPDAAVSGPLPLVSAA